MDLTESTDPFVHSGCPRHLPAEGNLGSHLHSSLSTPDYERTDMSVDLFKALTPFISGLATLIGGSLTGLNTMSGNEYS